MSKKKEDILAEFKTKVVLELLEGNRTRIQVISSTPHYAAKPSKILPKKTS